MKNLKMIVVALVVALVCGNCLLAKGLSFERTAKSEFLTVKSIKAVKGQVYIYATFKMGDTNPIKLVDGVPQWNPEAELVHETWAGKLTGLGPEESVKTVGKKTGDPRKGKIGSTLGSRYLETVTLAQRDGDEFVTVLRFGLAKPNGHADKAYVKPWVTDGYIDYFGGHARANTAYDFKIRINLESKKMTAWVSGRGDDDWFLLAENVTLTQTAEKLNEVQVEQYVNGPAIENLRVLKKVWAVGEKVRPHRLAKKDRVVGPGRGFKFQSMRSTWRKPGKHVTIARKPREHYGFCDVTLAGHDHLISVWRNGAHTGGRGGVSMSHSYDLGKTWSKPEIATGLNSNCPRIQKLKDGTLLLTTDVYGYMYDDNSRSFPIAMFDSTDGGKTWTNERWCKPTEIGGKGACVQSRITELSDGSWMLTGSWIGGSAKTGMTDPEQLEFYRSTDRGQTWEFWSDLLHFPPNNLSEATIIEMDDGRLLIYAREWRDEGMVGVKAFSDDMGKTWEVQDLPFPITGRTCAGLLKDGRVMVTYRFGVGRASLRAFVGDPLDTTEARPTGGHINDRDSVGLKDGMLHIDSDGIRGQFTHYIVRPQDTEDSTVDVTAEVKVVRNDGRAATISVPFAGKLRVFTDHVVMAHDQSLRVEVKPGKFHTYRIVSNRKLMKLYVDGVMRINTDKGDNRLKGYSGAKINFSGPTSGQTSYYALGFGNEKYGSWNNDGDVMNTDPDVYLHHIKPEVTGYSIWKRFDVVLDDPHTKKRMEILWSASKDGFPDQYQLDHVIEVEATVNGHEQGYSGWTQLDDGRIFVVNYTDDGADGEPGKHLFGIPYIRGTFVELSDLPPIGK
ncbi:sialidase family protein [Planctomycetota bacterium]